MRVSEAFSVKTVLKQVDAQHSPREDGKSVVRPSRTNERRLQHHIKILGFANNFNVLEDFQK